MTRRNHPVAAGIYGFLTSLRSPLSLLPRCCRLLPVSVATRPKKKKWWACGEDDWTTKRSWRWWCTVKTHGREDAEDEMKKKRKKEKKRMVLGWLLTEGRVEWEGGDVSWRKRMMVMLLARREGQQWWRQPRERECWGRNRGSRAW